VGGGRHKVRVPEGECGGIYFVFIHENSRMKPVEIVLRREGERVRTVCVCKSNYDIL
jgi:hypothetical protein